MAIYGLGTHYDRGDVSMEFVASGLACVGWSEVDAPAAHGMFRAVKVGDIFYLKSHSPKVGLIIKAVGLVINNLIRDDIYPDLGSCMPVKWVWSGREVVGRIDDKYNVRNITLYEEFNPDVQARVLSLLVDTRFTEPF